VTNNVVDRQPTAKSANLLLVLKPRPVVISSQHFHSDLRFLTLRSDLLLADFYHALRQVFMPMLMKWVHLPSKCMFKSGIGAIPWMRLFKRIYRNWSAIWECCLRIKRKQAVGRLAICKCCILLLIVTRNFKEEEAYWALKSKTNSKLAVVAKQLASISGEYAALEYVRWCCCLYEFCRYSALSLADIHDLVDRTQDVLDEIWFVLSARLLSYYRLTFAGNRRPSRRCRNGECSICLMWCCFISLLH